MDSAQRIFATSAMAVLVAILLIKQRRRNHPRQQESQQHVPQLPQQESQQHVPQLPQQQGQQQELVTEQQPPLLVMSFGCICLTARSLGIAHARTFAAPFDWIFSNPAVVSHIISDGGLSFLNREQYFKAEKSSSDSGHSHMQYSPMLHAGRKGQNPRAIIFNHHDPLNDAEDHAYLTRAVKRLLAALASPLPKLCVIISLEKRCKLVDAELDALLITLEKHSHPAAHVKLVAVKLLTAPHNDDQASAGTPSSSPEFGVQSSREHTLRNASLRVLEMRCRGGLGPSALSLSDETDRRELLECIFEQHKAEFDAGGRLVRPALATDPLAAALAACASNPSKRTETAESEQTGGQLTAGAAGRSSKYRDDGWLVKEAAAPTQGRSRPRRERRS